MSDKTQMVFGVLLQEQLFRNHGKSEQNKSEQSKGFGLMRERLQSVARVSAMLVSMAVLMGVASLVSLTEHVSFVGTVHANDIQVTNTAVADDSESGVRVVSFDLSWENSWRSADLDGSDDSNAGNWDAAWVFVKYRTAGGAWKHARLTASGHIAGIATGENMGEGAALQVGLVDQGSAYDASNNPGMGAMIYRGEAGAGRFAADSLTLRWDYAADGLTGSEEYFVEVYAVEMVYVAPGAFYAGSSRDGTEDARFVAGVTEGSASAPFLVTSNWDGCVSDTDGCLWASGSTDDSNGDANSMDAGGTLVTGFPTGFSGFYGMKYEVSQQQYVDFLNSLPDAQATARAYVGGADRSGISYVDPAGGVAGYYTTSTPYVANNYMSWMDAAAYLDWAGLRPMTELEYEKASRGYAEPVADGYAWGSTTITSTGGTSNYSSLGEAGESVSQGNAVYDGSNPGGPARVGIFAGAATSREQAGAGYWGIMELSGNVGEMVVTVGNEAGRGFTGLHGDGMLSGNGEAMVTSWPGLDVGAGLEAATPSAELNEGQVTGADGSGLRGGSLADDEALLATAVRTSATTGVSTRASNTGLRGARTMPDGSIFALTVQVSGDGAPNVGGTVSPSSGSYATGTQVELTATSSEGWVFSTWSSDVPGNLPDGATLTDSVLTITMDSDKSLTAEFEEETTEAEVIEVTSATGAVWMDRNLGANRAATSSTDTLSYGDLYQWGRAADGHEKRTSGTTSTLSDTDTPGHGDFILSSNDWRSSQNDNLWQGVDGVNNPCPVGFRVPTEAEWQEEIDNGGLTNSAGAFSSPLKLPVAGSRYFVDGSLRSVGSLGFYWSSSVDGTFARRLGFLSSSAFMVSNFRAFGYSVRCLKHVEEPGPTEVTSTTGAVWMDRNLGASQVATSSTDVDAYGDLYQWGRAADGHEKRTSGTTSTLSDTDTPGHGDFILSSGDWRSSQNDNLWQGVDGVNNPCPAGFRLPTEVEWEAERTSWNSNDNDGAIGSPLKLTMAGFRSNVNGLLNDVGSGGYYWSSTVDVVLARHLYLGSSGANLYSGTRAFGLSVRCLKDVEEPGPTEVTSTTGAVWMDRNLGASQVATSSTDAEAYGDLYQWGRAADGHEKRDSGTRSTLSDTDTPGHGDFILSSSDWRSSQNDNLWQGVDGVNNPCPAGFRLPTEVEWEAERTSWDSNDIDGAIGSPLKLPMAGFRSRVNGSLTNVGSYGLYWSSSVDGASASILYFSSSDANMYSDGRALGLSVRCLKD